MFKFIFIWLVAAVCPSVASTNKTLDSLQTVLKRINDDDTLKVKILDEIGYTYINTDNSLALKYLNDANQLANKLNYKRGLARILSSLASLNTSNGKYEEAIEFYNKSISSRILIGDSLGVSSCHGNLANMYSLKGDLSNALNHYLKSLKVLESIRYNPLYIAMINQNIGILHIELKNYQKAIYYVDKSISISSKNNLQQSLIQGIQLKGSIFHAQGKLEDALKYYLQGLNACEEKQENKSLIANICANIGEIYSTKKDFISAHKYLTKAQILYKDLGNILQSASVLINIANINRYIKNYDIAIMQIESSIKVGNEINAPKLLKDAYWAQYLVYKDMNEHGNALQYYELYSTTKDSIFNQEKNKAIIEMESKYESEKKQKEIELQDIVIKKQNLQRFALLGGLSLLIIIALIILRNLLTSKKKNKVIKMQNERLNDANTAIAQKNKDITDSINYARRIQLAIMEEKEVIYKQIPNSFILYMPRDIVSGDFYYYNKLNDDETILAVCDCTGHGVPGAFMSMIGNDQLNYAIIEKKITTPSKILDQLHEGIRFALHQNKESSMVRDGMDLSLCKINLKKKELEYAGAHRPLWVLRNGNNTEPKNGDTTALLDEIKADKFPIGGYQSEEERIFSNKIIQLNSGDTIYMFTDGYLDQFGGPKKKKLTTKRFREKILEIQRLSINEQEKNLSEYFYEWKGEDEQIDDVMVIGVRF